MPSLKTICETLEAGVTPILHCDGNWDKNLKALRKLPPKKCIIQFDGPTDIFRAKQETGDMHCLFGDVNAYDLVMSSSSKIDEYCHRLSRRSAGAAALSWARAVKSRPTLNLKT